MRPHALFFVLLTIGIVSAFVPSDYVYLSEGNVSYSYENFTVDGTDYSIVYFNGEETFLLKEGGIVNGSDEIETTIYDYYVEEYYPSESELDEVRSLVAAYDASRNNGYDFKNKEEDVCRGVLLTDKTIEVYINGTKQKLWCHDDASCQMNAMLLYQVYGYGLGWGSYTVALQPLKDFAYSSYGTDDIVKNMSERLNSTDETTLVSTIDYIQDSIPTLKSYAAKIEATIFRTPRLNDTEDREDCYLACYAICPSFDLDTTILDELDETLDSLSEKIQPFAEYETTAADIAQNTEDRINYRTTSLSRQHYEEIFSPLEETGTEVETYATNAYQLVGNTSLMMKTEELQSLRQTIRNKIDNATFTGVDDEITLYRAKISSVRDAADATYGLYNETVAAKNEANAILFELGTKDLSAPDLQDYNEIKDRVDATNLEFTAGITPEKMAEVKDEYAAAGEDAGDLLKRVSTSTGTTLVDSFRAFAIRMNDGIADLASVTEITDRETIPENKLTVLGGFSFVVFISFMSIVFLLFLYLMGISRTSQLKYILSAGLILMAVFAAVFSVLLYFFMDKTATEATLNEFLFDFGKKDTVALVANVDLATAGEASSIKQCADSFAAVIAGKNKTVDIYYLEPGNVCKKNGEEAVGCTADINGHDSVITLSPSMSIERPVLSTVFVSRADIEGTEDYYESCPLAVMFK